MEMQAEKNNCTNRNKTPKTRKHQQSPQEQVQLNKVPQISIPLAEFQCWVFAEAAHLNP